MALRFSPVSIPYKVPKNIKRRQWGLNFPVSNGWKKKKERILFVIDHVTREDLSNKQLLSGETGEMFMNVLEYSEKIAKSWGCEKSFDDFGVAFVSWNYFKTYDLDRDQQKSMNYTNVKRMQQIIKKLNPTHIHFFGEEPAILLYDIDVEKRGWVIEKDGLTISSNISITNEAKAHVNDDDDDNDDFDAEVDSAYEDDDVSSEMGVDKSNLLGYACENLARLLNGSYPFSLNHLKPKYVVIDTMEKWKKLFKALWKSSCISYDLETANLTVTENQILMAQFTIPKKPNISYELPLKHMSSPWTAKQLKEIYTDMRKLFARKFDHWDWDTPYLIGQNIGFDLRVTRQELAIPQIHYRVWDCMAGEQALDENMKSVNTKSVSDAEANAKNKPWALDSILTRYENDFYYTAKFGKADRVTIKDIELNNEVYEYGAMDTIGPYHIHLMQQKRAELLSNDKDDYLPVYRKLILGMYSDTIHVQSTMMQSGVQADVDYIVKQHAAETSDIDKERKRLIKELYKLPAVKRANAHLLEEHAMPTDSIFAGTDAETDAWMFNIDDQEHQKLLFFEIMELEPVVYTASGKPSVGKPFLKAYSKEGSNAFREEVKLFQAIGESKKVRGYIKGYFEKLCEPDGINLGRIIASYGFSMVVTGRSNSFSPSLQQVPNHGQYAKMVKRVFVAMKGRVIVKMDYSAHEIGCWCIISGDTQLAKTFKKIWNLWLKYRKDPTDENLEAVKNADAHKLNYNTFTGTPVEDITPEQRQSSKGITFGAMYGKHVRSMARDLNMAIEIMEAIYDRFFGKFKKAKRWLDKTVKRARTKLYTYNPFGFRRNLFGYLTANRRLEGAMDRRAQNSPIQGFASQLGFIAARMFLIKINTAFEKEGMISEPRWNKEKAVFEIDYPEFNLNAMVHDSTEVETSYELVPLITQAMEHCATSELMKYCTKMYGIQWPIRPQVDFDIGDTAADIKGWNFSKPSLKECIQAAWKNHNKRHPGAVKKEEALMALKPTKRVKRMLKSFPLDLTPYEDV